MVRPSPTRTFTLVGVISEVPLWSLFLVGAVWWIEELSFSPARVIVLGIALEVAVLFTEVPTGVMADRYSRRWSVQISFLLIGASLLLHAATTNFIVLVASLLLVGLGWTFRSGADIAWLTDQLQDEAASAASAASADSADGAANAASAEDRVGAAIVRRQLIILLTNVVTVPITVVLGLWSIRGTIAIFGALTLLGGLLVAPLLDGVGNADTELGARDIAREGRAVATGSPVIRRVLIVTFVVALAGPAVDWLGLERFLTQGDFDDGSLVFTGVLFVAAAVSAAATVRVTERRVDAGTELPSLAASLLLVMAVGAALVAISPVAAIALGILLRDMAWEAFNPVVSAWVNPHADESSRATVHSIVGQTQSFGEFTGGVVAVAVTSFVGVAEALVLAAAFSLVAAVAARSAPTSPKLRSNSSAR